MSVYFYIGIVYMSLSNILNKTAAEVVPYNITVNSMNATSIEAANLIVDVVDQDTVHVNLIGGLTIPDEVIVEASLVPLDDNFYDLGDPTHSWSNIYADNFVVNTISTTEVDCDTLKGLSAEDLQIDLQTAGILSIGATGDLSAIQFQSNGVITSDSASGLSSLSLGNGGGSQLILDPSTLSLIGSPNLGISTAGGLQITAGSAVDMTNQDLHVNHVASVASDLMLQSVGGQILLDASAGAVITAGNNLVTTNIFSAGGLALDTIGGTSDLGMSAGRNIFATAATDLSLAATAGFMTLSSGTDTNISAGGTLYASSVGDLTIQNYAPSNMLVDTGGDLVLQGFGNVTVSAQTASATISGQTTCTVISGSGTVVRAQTNNVQLNSVAGDIQMLCPSGTITSSAQFYSGPGSSGAPTYSFSTDGNTGVFQTGVADTLGFSSGGSVRMTVDNTNVTVSDMLIPVSANTYDCGSNALPWRNIYSNNLLNVVSDQRMKKNVRDLPVGLDLIKKVRPISYQLIQDPDNSEKKLGVIAQELELAIHQCGYEGYDIVTKGDIYSVKYEALIGPLINAVKELAVEVERLRARVNV